MIEFEDDGISGFYDDDGNKLNPELIPKPGLCTACIHDEDESQYTLCTLTRFDQEEGKEFICHAFQERKSFE